jgi:hypothetical protein
MMLAASLTRWLSQQVLAASLSTHMVLKPLASRHMAVL